MNTDNRPRIVSVDSMVLAYAIRRTPGPSDKVRRAKRLFAELDQDKAVIIISTVVVTEYLKAVAQDDRERTAEEIGSRFQVESFDLKDTVLASKLWDDGEGRRRRGEEGYRNRLKADAIIIATAVNRGVGEFFTEDADSLKMAIRFGMVARNLPDFGVPDMKGPSLFKGGE